MGGVSIPLFCFCLLCCALLRVALLCCFPSPPPLRALELSRAVPSYPCSWGSGRMAGHGICIANPLTAISPYNTTSC